MKALAALADPFRRRIVEMLIDGERSAGDLGSLSEISQPGVSKHLRVLREAGLVNARTRGRLRLYRLNPAPLAEVDAWFSRYRGSWQERLDSLKVYVEGEVVGQVTPIHARYPVRGLEAAGLNACGRRLRSLGMPARLDQTAA